MAPTVNRTALVLNLTAFVGFSVFCVSTEAPLMQQDILVRCRETLVRHRIPVDGLTVNGRDVILSGPPDSAITNSATQSLIAATPGVRDVRVNVSYSENAHPTKTGLEVPGNQQQQDLQTKIDLVLENQGIAFKTDSTVITPDSGVALDKIASYLSAATNLRCEIRGYDNHPNESKQSWVLAMQRALATEDYLVAKGIAEWRLSAHAFQNGEGSEGRPTNRTVDLVVKAR